MLKFTLTIDCNNAAFAPETDDHPSYETFAEIARILREIAARVENGAIQQMVRDTSGNGVGVFNLAAE